MKKIKQFLFICLLIGQLLGNQSFALGQNVSNAAGSNSITIIIDVSGSMRGQPLAAAKRSSLVLIDLIELWSSIYPQAIGNMQIQFILFGAGEEVKLLQPLTNLRGTDFTALKEKIWDDGTQFGGTDYSLGIEEAIRQLTNKGLNNKTIFLSDAGDEGKGPLTAIDYRLLGETKFILYEEEGNIDNWLKALPDAEAIPVQSEFEVTSHFVATLFEFVDDINKYLVRRGSNWTGNRQPFLFEKHSPSAAHDLIITRRDPNVTLEGIRDKQGQALKAEDYLIYQSAPTFYQVRLNEKVPKGVYQLIFSSQKERSQQIRYISFERCNIQLRPRFNSQLDACFLEQENINFQFEFWDEGLDLAVNYDDFLPFIAYGIKIGSEEAVQFSKDLTALNFTKNYPIGNVGSYQIYTSWNYNLNKLKKAEPPLQLVDSLCVIEDGRLVNLSFDTSQTWEGRSLSLSARVDKVDSTFLNIVTSLFINIGEEIIELKQAAPNSNQYLGQIGSIEAKSYHLSIDNRIGRYKIGLSEQSITQFEGKKRYFKIKATTRKYKKLDSALGFLGKLKLAWSSLKGEKHYYQELLTFDSPENIEIPYDLPFYEGLNDQIPIQIELNKLFPDEKLALNLMIKDENYPFGMVHSAGWWGAFQQNFSSEEALKVHFVLNGPQKAGEAAIVQTAIIQKIEGDINFERILRPAPYMLLQGQLTMQSEHQHRQLIIPNQRVELALKTSYWSRFWTQMERQAKWLFCLTAMFLLLLFIVLISLKRRIELKRRLQKWKNDCKHQSPEDFYPIFPKKAQKLLSQLVKENKDNPTLYPNHLKETDMVKSKRMLRYKIRQQKGQDFDKRLISCCTMDFLNDLGDKLRQRNIENVKWEFGIAPKQVRTIRLVAFEPDLQRNREDFIRVRTTAESNYGEFEIRETGLFFHNRYNIVYVQNKSTGYFEWKDIGSRTSLSTGQIIQFGPDRDSPYFKAEVFFTPQSLHVTISVG